MNNIMLLYSSVAMYAIRGDHIGGVMVSMLASKIVDLVFEPRSA
jgi:hypothetical protein